MILKVITFIDLAGHEKYLKTTVFGMTGHLPDFCMLMVCYYNVYWFVLYASSKSILYRNY